MPGDGIAVTGPFGAPFEVPADKSARLLMVGLGTGIAPFLGLLKRMYRDAGAWKGKVLLLYGAHTGPEMLYMNNARDDIASYHNEKTFEAIKTFSPRPGWASRSRGMNRLNHAPMRSGAWCPMSRPTSTWSVLARFVTHWMNCPANCTAQRIVGQK
jgi:ferredoxin-NADP reductase